LQNPQVVSGGSPGGSGTELQYRGGASTFSALSGSSVPNSGETQFGNAISPAASVTRAIQTIGAAIAAGSANGNMHGVNAPSGFTGYLYHAELNGSPRFTADYAGRITSYNPSSVATGLAPDASSMIMHSIGRAMKFASDLGAFELQVTSAFLGVNSPGWVDLNANGTTTVRAQTNGDLDVVNGGVNTIRLKTTPVAVSALPTCNSGSAGTVQAVNDANGPAWGVTVASGGSAFAQVVCNGTNWRVTGI